MAKKFVVDSEACTACGLCYSTHDFITQDDEGKPKSMDLSDDQVNDAQDAVDNCPVDALKLEDAWSLHF